MAALYDWQKEDAHLVARRRGIILSSALGTGKTYIVSAVVGAYITAALAKGVSVSVLVVCRNDNKKYFADTLREFVPPETTIIVSGRGGRYIGSAKGPTIFVTHYYTLQDKQALALALQALGGRIDALVIDEGHHTKKFRYRNSKNSSLQARAAYALALSTAKNGFAGGLRILMTGTPIEKTGAELWGLVHIVDPLGQRWPLTKQTFTSFWRWAETVFGVTLTRYGRKVGSSPICKEAELLYQAVIKEYVYSREVEGVAEVDTHLVYFMLNAEQLSDYARLLAAGWLEQGDKFYVLAGASGLVGTTRWLAKLPQKYEKLVEVAQQHKGESGVVFTRYRDTAQAAIEALRSAGFVVYSQVEYEDWKVEERPAILVGTFAKIAESLNLQKAGYGVFLEVPLKATEATQAQKRIARLGQVKEVVPMYHFVWQGTAEDLLYQKVVKKQNVQAKLLQLAREAEILAKKGGKR